VHCLNAVTGEPIWRSQLVAANVPLPEWGYASSPVLVGDVVVVLPGRPKGAAALGLDRETGQQLWAAGEGEHSYTSPHRATLGGTDQILALTSAGLTGIDSLTGKVLSTYVWPSGGARCVQPYCEDDAVVISSFFEGESRKLKLDQDGNVWREVWKSQDMKPYFNDLVVQDGHAYGFDNNIFCCLNLASGKRAWKGGRYGNGQVLLLARQQQLLVLSETGDVILLEANPKEHKELAQFPAIEGKTWNHPVVARGKLFVRNGIEMACFDVSPPVSARYQVQ
jgi:outer membrane protein assembly factor BamB